MLRSRETQDTSSSQDTSTDVVATDNSIPKNGKLFLSLSTTLNLNLKSIMHLVLMLTHLNELLLKNRRYIYKKWFLKVFDKPFIISNFFQ